MGEIDRNLHWKELKRRIVHLETRIDQIGIHSRPIEILSVDDSPSDQLVLSHVFQPFAPRFHMHFVGDAMEALAFLRRVGKYEKAPRPDLVLLDLNLPLLTGREFLHVLKEAPDLQTIPVLILSSSNDQNDISECLRLRAKAFFTKPSNLADYPQMIQSLPQYC